MYLILEKEDVNAFAKKLDAIADWKKIIPNKFIGNIAEIGDRMIFKAYINMLNDNSDKIPEKFHDNIKDAVYCFISEDYIGFIPIVSDLISDLGIISSAIMDDEFASKLIEINIEAGLKLAKFYAEKNQ